MNATGKVWRPDAYRHNPTWADATLSCRPCLGAPRAAPCRILAEGRGVRATACRETRSALRPPRARAHGPVLGIVHRVMVAWLTDQAGVERNAARTGAVTLIQRFGSALNLDVHFHRLSFGLQ